MRLGSRFSPVLVTPSETDFRSTKPPKAAVGAAGQAHR